MPAIDAEYEIKRRVDFIEYKLELSARKTLVPGTDQSVANVTRFYTRYGDGTCDDEEALGVTFDQIDDFLEGKKSIQTPRSG